MLISLIWASLLSNAWSGSVSANRLSCIYQLTSRKPSRQARLNSGTSAELSLARLRDYESIPVDVVERYNREASALPRVTVKASHALALDFRTRYSEASEDKLFRSLQPLALRPLRSVLPIISDSDVLEDYIQVAYEELFRGIRDLLKSPSAYLQNYKNWTVILWRLKIRIWRAVVAHTKTYYPSYFENILSPKQEFLESLLIYGADADRRLALAELFGVNPESAEREWQRFYLPEIFEESYGLIPDPEDILELSQRRTFLSHALTQVSARDERAVRRYYLGDEAVSHSEIGDEIGVSHNRVGQLIARGVRKVQRLRDDLDFKEAKAEEDSSFRPAPQAPVPAKRAERKPEVLDASHYLAWIEHIALALKIDLENTEPSQETKQPESLKNIRGRIDGIIADGKIYKRLVRSAMAVESAALKRDLTKRLNSIYRALKAVED